MTEAKSLWTRINAIAACTQIVEDYVNAVEACAVDGLCISTAFKVGTAASCTAACVAGLVGELVDIPNIKGYMAIACGAAVAGREICVKCSPPKRPPVVPMIGELAQFILILPCFSFGKEKIEEYRDDDWHMYYNNGKTDYYEF